jgi:hypothetical protein
MTDALGACIFRLAQTHHQYYSQTSSHARSEVFKVL